MNYQYVNYLNKNIKIKIITYDAKFQTWYDYACYAQDIGSLENPLRRFST
jgi:hypothetical protein